MKYTGVPVLMYDKGSAKSRSSPRVTFVLAERGTCFALWKDTIDNLSNYKVSGPAFHTMCLSTGNIFHKTLLRNCSDFISTSCVFRTQQINWIQFRLKRCSDRILAKRGEINQQSRKHRALCSRTKTQNETAQAKTIANEISDFSSLSVFTRNECVSRRHATLSQLAGLHEK